MWPGEQAPPPLPPPVGKGYDFPAGNPFDWKSRGLRPSRALPECSGEDFGSRRCGAWGALLPYTPSGTGCERVHTLSRSPGGCSIGDFGFRRNRRAVHTFRGCLISASASGKMPVAFLLGTEAGESHIFTSRFRRSFSLQRNAFTALFRRTGCKRCLHPAAPKNGEFMKLID